EAQRGSAEGERRFDPSFPALKIQSQLMAALLPPHDEVCVKIEEDGLGAIVPVDLFINSFPLVEVDGFEVAPWSTGNAHNAAIAELYGTPQVSAPPTSPI
uniref:Uncharacterized protein n=1 Tax=Aegilops tauschii subsp. strangulata TaxID=200361 RepID=A0A453QQ60_AEGTS